MRRTGAQTVAYPDDLQLIQNVKLARLCNTQPWVIERLPAELITPYVELLEAIERANSEIAQENIRRVKGNEGSLLRRITLVD